MHTRKMLCLLPRRRAGLHAPFFPKYSIQLIEMNLTNLGDVISLQVLARSMTKRFTLNDEEICLWRYIRLRLCVVVALCARAFTKS